VSEPTKPAPDEPFLAGEFLVVPERNELRRIDDKTLQASSEPLRLTSKQMGVLLVLAAKPGQPVSKNELFDAVWPGVSVGEDNITSCMYALRQAFGDQAYIKTVRQRGYLLNAAVVRPAPAELVAAAAAPEKPATKDIVVPVADLEALAAPTEPLPRQALDRQGRRQLAIWLSVLALLVTGGLFGIDHYGNFTVGLENCENRSGDSEFDSMAEKLRQSLFERFKAQPEPAYYRVWRLGLFSSTTLSCSIEPLPEGWIELRAAIDTASEDARVELAATGPREDIIGLTTQLFEKVRRALDAQVCRMDSPPDLLKARHCFNAGARQLKTRSWEEARELLTKAKDYYRQLDQPEVRKAAAEGLLLTYDQLANYYDIQGQRQYARQMIDEAHLVLSKTSLGIDSSSPGARRIVRREAQVEGDLPTERGVLEEFHRNDPQDTDWRHSFGWFVFTHERDCNYAEKIFAEALVDHEIDPAIRATYHSYLGDIRLACGEPNKALAAYEEHVRLARDHADPYEMRGNALMMVGRYDEARTDLLQALQLDDTLYSAIASKGNLERDLGYFQDAFGDYQRALAMAGDKPNPRRDLLIAIGRLALLKGSPDEALAAADEAAKLEGGNRIQAYWLQGLALLDLGRVEAAHGALRNLESQFANESRHLREYLSHLKAQIALAESRGDEALRELDEALDNHPADQLLFLSAKAEALEKVGRDREAFAAYQELLEVNRFYPRSLCAAANLAVKLSKPQEAATLYVRALDNLGQRTDDPVCRKCLERGRAYGEVR
jgi:DNA-binding winged helix-turn-helix (wHTH) protein/tetratricopeptide (TPR) repeat protein